MLWKEPPLIFLLSPSLPLNRQTDQTKPNWPDTTRHINHQSRDLSLHQPPLIWQQSCRDSHLVPDMGWANTWRRTWNGQTLGAGHGMVTHLVSAMAWHGMAWHSIAYHGENTCSTHTASRDTLHNPRTVTWCQTWDGETLGVSHGVQTHSHSYTHSSESQHTTDGPPIHETIIQ